MGGIKRTPADIALSDCIREKVDWVCQRCKKYYPEGRGRAGLHAAHFHGRGGWSTRLEQKNLLSLCFGCHMHTGAHRGEHEDLMKEVYGEDIIDILALMNANTNLGKIMKKNQKQIAKHYREQLAIMQKKRANGNTKIIQFESWSG